MVHGLPKSVCEELYRSDLPHYCVDVCIKYREPARVIACQIKRDDQRHQKNSKQRAHGQAPKFG